MNIINERRSIRKYTTEMISREEIEQIVQAGIEAPSAQNRQPWKYLVYMGESKKQLLDVMEQGLIRERDV